MPTDIKTLGIDPASGKGLMVFEPGAAGDSGFEEVAARNASAWWRNRIRLPGSARVLVGWDSPLWFYAGVDEQHWTWDRSRRRNPSIATRPVEQFLSRVSNVPVGVNTRPFSGLSHWVISQLVLGLPREEAGVDSADVVLVRWPTPLAERADLPLVAETHPAVTLWCVLGDVPAYKKDRAVCAQLYAMVREYTADARLPVALPTGSEDDRLDAVASWLSVEALAQGRAILIGSPVSGGFWVPATEKAKQLQDSFIECFPPSQ